MNRYYVYILASRYQGATYIGVTNNLEKRIAQHKSGELGGYTFKWNIKRLVLIEEFQFIDDAIAREKQLKKWRRQWKWDLIEKNNPEWRDISNI